MLGSRMPMLPALPWKKIKVAAVSPVSPPAAAGAGMYQPCSATPSVVTIRTSSYGMPHSRGDRIFAGLSALRVLGEPGSCGT